MRVSTETIKALNPCQSRLDNYLIHHAKFEGTLIKFLKLKHITDQDKVWVVCRIAPREVIEIFALDCAFASYDYYTKLPDAVAYAAAAADAAADAADAAAAYAADAAYAATYAAAAAAYAAAYADEERSNQTQALIYLCKGL